MEMETSLESIATEIKLIREDLRDIKELLEDEAKLSSAEGGLLEESYGDEEAGLVVTADELLEELRE